MIYFHFCKLITIQKHDKTALEIAQKKGCDIINFLENSAKCDSNENLTKHELEAQFEKLKHQLKDQEQKIKQHNTKSSSLQLQVQENSEKINKFTAEKKQLEQEKDSTVQQEVAHFKSRCKNLEVEIKSKKEKIGELEKENKLEEEERMQDLVLIQALEEKFMALQKNLTIHEPWVFSAQLANSEKWKNYGVFQTLEMQQGEFVQDWKNVISLWNLSSNLDCSIEKIIAIKNDALQKFLEDNCVSSSISQFSWDNLDHKNTRKQTLDRLGYYQLGKKDNIYIVPFWYGASTQDDVTVNLLCSSGFLNVPKTNNPFGTGIHGTLQAEYAARVYGKGVCFLSFAFISNPFPVVPEDIPKMASGTPLGDVHVVPVVPRDKQNPNETVYDVAKANEVPVYDQLVLFHPERVIPRYMIVYKKIE